MDVFTREQNIYEEALAMIKSATEETKIDTVAYKELTEEYEKLLKQFVQYKGMIKKQAVAIEKNEAPGKEHFDVLTGIFNKRYLTETLDRTLAAMNRAGDMLSVLLIDVDFFKEYNNLYGRGAGEDCLRFVAEVLKSCLFRGQDFVARYGGQEFMAILPHTQEHGARLVADRMLGDVRRLQLPHGDSPVAGNVTISIGIVTGAKNPETGWVSADFFKRVDEALFQAKNHGRDQYAFLGL